MTTATLHHVAIEVTDIRRAAAFYDAVLGRLGLKRFTQGEGYGGWANDSLSVWVIEGHPARVRRHPVTGDEEVVADHLGFRVGSATEVEAVQADLEAKGIFPVFRGEEHPEFSSGYFSATWADPDGAVLEIYYVPVKPRRRGRTGARKARPKARRRRGR